jgi:hypothetical protein
MITISSLPVAYNVTGGGSYCEDGGGLEIGLDGSQAGVQYELLNDLSSTGIIVTGTGFAISFGTVTQAGTYSVSAIDPSTACENLMSNTVDVEIIPLPVVYPVGGGGAYCFGTNGSTITLSGSQLGHTYELYLEGQPTGTVANGTGNAISFGNITAVGTYTVIAMENTLSCENTMDGSVEVSVAFPPEMAAIPQGPIAVDLFSTFESEYSTDGSLGADEYEWLFEPLEAGSTSSIDLTTVRVTWNPEFLGEVTLRVRGVNECGPGDWSEALLITVYNTVGFEDGTEAMDVRISPNPGSGMFYLNFAGQPSEDVDVSVMNLLGETVFSKSGLSVDGDFTERIDLQGVPGGIYMLRVESRSGTVVEKFIIQ